VAEILSQVLSIISIIDNGTQDNDNVDNATISVTVITSLSTAATLDMI